MEEKIRNREKLKTFALDIERYRLGKVNLKHTITLNKEQKIKVIDAEYNSEMGLMSIIVEDQEVQSNII